MPVTSLHILGNDGVEGIIDGANPVPVSIVGSGGGQSTPVTITNPAALDPWRIWSVQDVAADDSDKTLMVPAGYEYQILWLYVQYTSTATVGTRQLEVRVYNSAGTMIGQVRPGVTQAASLTYYYMFAPSLADLSAVRDTDYIMTPLPPTLFLPALYYIRIFDNNVIAAAADDMLVYMQVARREV